ncbi:response regulator [Segetibacter koreensis]|uniref:response regulator n=1 Tax=Segetibacter koreensis TaxID=398037 RepID=UPI00037DBFF5|nr:response regulator [Segetibacter koreensis]
MNTAPILIVDDDLDDQEFLQEAWKELDFTNKLIFFKTAEEVLNYLKQEKESPFLIISDVNLPKMNGFELKEKILNDTSIRYKSIPFVFFSNTATNKQIEKSYDLGSNGFFIKGQSMTEIKNTFTNIVNYWQKSKTPE